MAAKPKKPAWKKIQADYYAGMKPQELSEKYHIPMGTLRNHIRKEKWAHNRVGIRKKVVENALSQAIKQNKNDLLRKMKADKALYLSARKVAMDQVFVIKKGRAVAPQTKKIVSKSGEFADVPVSAHDIADAMRAVNIAEDEYRRSVGLSDRDSISKVAWYDSRDGIAADAGKLETLEEMAKITPRIIQCIDSPEAAQAAIINTLDKKERMDYIKQEVATKTQIERFLAGLEVIVENLFADHPEKLAAYNQSVQKLMEVFIK